MGPLTGTGRLVRLALRRDRIKLPVWILAITGGMVANVAAVLDLYGKSEQALIGYATTAAPSLISRIFGGPISGPQIGEVIMNETFLFIGIAIAFMSTLTVIRHTRQNEETGRSELIGSAAVGRNASLTAAILVAIGANIIVTGLLALTFAANDQPAAQSIGAAAALGSIGIIFTLIAAITAQISDSARGANSLAAAVIGVAFMLRAIGDGLGKLTADGMGVVSSWPSWLSPIGWMQQIYPFTQGRWWIFILFGGLFAVLLGVAFYLNAIRDIGLGMISAKKGPAVAARSLLSPLGLAWRLQHGVLRGWSIGIIIMGLTIGLVSKEFSSMFESNPQLAETLQQMGGGDNFNDIFFSSMFTFMGIAIAAYVVQALQRMRSEEAGGQLEPILSTGVSKQGWMLSHITCAYGGTLLLFILLGASSAATYVLANDTSWSEFMPLVGASLAPVPAVLIIGSAATAFFGLLPRLSIALAWSIFAVCFVLAQFGPLLKLPQGIMNMSPFTHIPAAPAESIQAAPLLALLGIALALTIGGLATFRRRDLTTS